MQFFLDSHCVLDRPKGQALLFVYGSLKIKVWCYIHTDSLQHRHIRPTSKTYINLHIVVCGISYMVIIFVKRYMCYNNRLCERTRVTKEKCPSSIERHMSTTTTWKSCGLENDINLRILLQRRDVKVLSHILKGNSKLTS